VRGGVTNVRTSRMIVAMAAVAVLCFAAAAAASPPALRTAIDRPSDAGAAYVPGEILVKFRDGVGPAEQTRSHAALGGTVLYESPYAGFQRVAIPAGRTVPEMVEAYSRNPNVLYAEPNSICHASMVPNDPYYPYQWHFPMIGMEEAWDLQTGDPGVVVAVADTGVAYEDYGAYLQAPDLAGTSFVHGYDFVNNDSHPNDDHAHGTHVTGTVAQTTNNSLGVAGIAFNTSIMPVKVLNSSGSGTAQTLADGIYFATDNGADVISMSLSWPAGYNPGATVYNAIRYAYDHGVVQVAASGNEGVGTVSYPAAYNEVIAVGALNSAEQLASYSQYGSAQEMVAPGGDNVDRNGDGYIDGVLQQTFATNQPTNFGYYFYYGTSMATPHVSATVALLIAHGASGVENIRAILHDTAVDLGAPGWDATYGYGLVDAYAALQALGPATPVSVSDIDMSLNKRGVNYWATGTVTVVDDLGNPVEGATVYGQWSGATGDSDAGVTDAIGRVAFDSDTAKKPASGTTFTLTVIDVQKSGYTFEPGPNDTNSISVP